MIDVNSHWDSASCHLFFLSLSICRRFFSSILLTLFWNNIFPRGRFSPVDHPEIAQIQEYYNSLFSPTHILLHNNVLPKSLHPEVQTFSLNHFTHVLTFYMLQISSIEIYWIRFPVLLFISFSYCLSLFDGTFTTNPVMLLNFPVDLQEHLCKIIINTL